MIRRVVRLADQLEVADLVARRLLDRVISVQNAKGQVHLCLTGGDTANLMYERFAALAPESELDPSCLELWWGDERFLPAAHEDRNSLQAFSRLARTISLTSAQIHMMPAKEGRADADECAAEYAAELGETHFDVTLLGLGIDGHIGSVFPHHSSFEPTSRNVIGVTDAPKPPSDRISLTLPALNRCDELWFMVTGAHKAGAVASSIDGDPSMPGSYARGREATYWFLDTEAAGELPASFMCLL